MSAVLTCTTASLLLYRLSFLIVMGKIVTLGDAALTTGDLGLLVPPAWLNDQLISFWCEHLRIHVLQNHSQVAILLPNVAYFIALTKGNFIHFTWYSLSLFYTCKYVTKYVSHTSLMCLQNP